MTNESHKISERILRNDTPNTQARRKNLQIFDVDANKNLLVVFHFVKGVSKTDFFQGYQ